MLEERDMQAATIKRLETELAELEKKRERELLSDRIHAHLRFRARYEDVFDTVLWKSEDVDEIPTDKLFLHFVDCAETYPVQKITVHRALKDFAQWYEDTIRHHAKNKMYFPHPVASEVDRYMQRHQKHQPATVYNKILTTINSFLQYVLPMPALKLTPAKVVHKTNAMTFKQVYVLKTWLRLYWQYLESKVKPDSDEFTKKEVLKVLGKYFSPESANVLQQPGSFS